MYKLNSQKINFSLFSIIKLYVDFIIKINLRLWSRNRKKVHLLFFVKDVKFINRKIIFYLLLFYLVEAFLNETVYYYKMIIKKEKTLLFIFINILDIILDFISLVVLNKEQRDPIKSKHLYTGIFLSLIIVFFFSKKNLNKKEGLVVRNSNILFLIGTSLVEKKDITPMIMTSWSFYSIIVKINRLIKNLNGYRTF